MAGDTWRDDEGRTKTFVTNKPVGTTTFFSGGDENGHEIMRAWAKTNPLVPFVWGILMGHWWW